MNSITGNKHVYFGNELKNLRGHILCVRTGCILGGRNFVPTKEELEEQKCLR